MVVIIFFKFNKDAAFRRNFLCCDHQNIFSHTTHRHKPVRSTSLRESPFLHTDAWESANFLLGYNQQLSTSQIHKQSFVLLHWVFFFCFFPLTGEWKEKEKRSRQRDFVPSSIGFFPFTAEQMPRGWWRLWACAAGTAFRCAWSPEPMTAQPLHTFLKSCFSLGRRLWNIHPSDRTLLPTSCIQQGRACSLFGCFFHLLHSTLSLSLPLVAVVNSTIASSVWATGKTGWWSPLCDDTQSHAQLLVLLAAVTRKR